MIEPFKGYVILGKEEGFVRELRKVLEEACRIDILCDSIDVKVRDL